MDLLAQLDLAEKRPLGVALVLDEPTIGGRSYPSLVTPAPSRVTWTIGRLPRRGWLRAGLGVSPAAGTSRVNFRVGISDGRTYETLAEQIVSSEDASDGWRWLAVDLSRYAGPQWRLFFRPDARRWEIILATAAIDGAPPAAYWAAPRIDTDRAAARLYHEARSSARR